MERFTLLFQIFPSAIFGLPDGEKVVTPASENPREIYGPTLDTVTGKIVGHGTLSTYRKEEQILSSKLALNDIELNFQDNFLWASCAAKDAQAAANHISPRIDTFLQSLSALHTQRFFAHLLSVEDSNRRIYSVNSRYFQVSLLNITMYSTQELKEKISQAAHWAESADQLATKSLFYYEHACLMNEFSQGLSIHSPHAAFSRSMAFLQLYKALTTIIGDPSSDRDHQSRPKKLGLSPDFFEKKAKPLYKIRSQEDVAHYSEEMPDPYAFLQQYAEAERVYVEALTAYFRTKT